MSANANWIWVQALTFFSSVRVFFYVKQVFDFNSLRNNLDTHSLQLSAIITVSNFTVVGAFYVKTGSFTDLTVLMSLFNSLVLSVMAAQLVYKRMKYKGVSEKHIKHPEQIK